MHPLTADILALARCKASAAPGNREYAAIPTAAIYAVSVLCYGLGVGAATDAVRAAVATGEVGLTADGKALEPLVVAPRTMDDCHAGADLADRMYTSLVALRAALGVEDAILPYLE